MLYPSFQAIVSLCVFSYIGMPIANVNAVNIPSQPFIEQLNCKDTNQYGHYGVIKSVVRNVIANPDCLSIKMIFQGLDDLPIDDFDIVYGPIMQIYGRNQSGSYDEYQITNISRNPNGIIEILANYTLSMTMSGKNLTFDNMTKVYLENYLDLLGVIKMTKGNKKVISIMGRELYLHVKNNIANRGSLIINDIVNIKDITFRLESPIHVNLIQGFKIKGYENMNISMVLTSHNRILSIANAKGYTVLNRVITPSLYDNTIELKLVLADIVNACVQHQLNGKYDVTETNEDEKSIKTETSTDDGNTLTDDSIDLILDEIIDSIKKCIFENTRIDLRLTGIVHVSTINDEVNFPVEINCKISTEIPLNIGNGF